MPGLIFADKTSQLRGIIFNVRNELKSGWSEEIYHQALVHKLEEQGIPTKSKPRQAFLHRGTELHLFEPDLIVWDCIILELKTLPFQKQFTGAHYAQIIHYLKFLDMSLGLLVNFGPARVNIKRVLWTNSPYKLEENYDAIHKLLYEQDKAPLRKIRQLVLTIADEFGLGYPETLYRKLVAIEAGQSGLDCVSNLHINASFNGVSFGNIQTNYLQFEGKYLVHIRSLLENPPTHDFMATKSYLNALGLKFALVVNFGKRKLQIFGVSSE